MYLVKQFNDGKLRQFEALAEFIASSLKFFFVADKKAKKTPEIGHY